MRDSSRARIRSSRPWADEQDAGQHGEPDQRRQAAARQHPVVDLEHEERAGQHQHVADATEDGDAGIGAAERAQCTANSSLPVAGRSAVTAPAGDARTAAGPVVSTIAGTPRGVSQRPSASDSRPSTSKRSHADRRRRCAGHVLRELRQVPSPGLPKSCRADGAPSAVSADPSWRLLSSMLVPQQARQRRRKQRPARQPQDC